MVRRIFVEKKKGFDVEAQGMCEDIRTNLGIAGLENVRVLNRYDVDGIDDELYEKAVYSVLLNRLSITFTKKKQIFQMLHSYLHLNIFLASMTRELTLQRSVSSSSAWATSQK